MRELSDLITERITEQLVRAGGWMGFDQFMELALYSPGLGYYTRGAQLFGQLPQGQLGSDFVTAPELSPLFGKALARQIAQSLQQSETDEIWEFGAGSGALALQILDAMDEMGQKISSYTIVDLSASLKERQAEKLKKHAAKVRWESQLPEKLSGVIVGNEVLDAMPVKLLIQKGDEWFERGITSLEAENKKSHWQWSDKPTQLRFPAEMPAIAESSVYLSELHQQAEGFIATLADRLENGSIFLIDYGFPESEYYHAQRNMGTLMCHKAHVADTDPLVDVGSKDITSHVNFTGIALAAQNNGLEVLGYTSQAHFLLNCGLAELMKDAGLADRANANKLIMEHEMGELFKVIGLTRGDWWQAMGFAHGDRTHRL